MSLISLQIEHHTEEQQLTDSVTEELSESDMKCSESATESTESVPLSLVDIPEIIAQDSVPEEATADVISEGERKIEGKDGLKTSANDITIHG